MGKHAGKGGSHAGKPKPGNPGYGGHGGRGVGGKHESGCFMAIPQAIGALVLLPFRLILRKV